MTLSRATQVLATLIGLSGYGAPGAPPPSLLRDGGFEATSQAWAALGKPRYALDPDAGRRGGALRYRKTDDEGEENSHFDQIVAVRPATVYVASVWAKGSGALRPVLRVATMEWQDLAVAQATRAGRWQRLEAVFESGEHAQVRVQLFGGALTAQRESAVGTSWFDDGALREATAEEVRAMHECEVTVDAAAVVRPIDPRVFGVNTLFMVEDDASLADGKIAAHLKAMPCRLLRYPGGDMADNYLWKTHSLDDPRHWPRIGGPQTTDTDEFMALCRQVGAEPILVVNLETGFVHNDLDRAVRDAADWVAYCNKQHDYGVKLWEIGNETYLYVKGKHKRARVTARQYGQALVRFATAMKAVDPSIRLGAIGPMSATTVSNWEEGEPREPWWPAVVAAAGPRIDFAVVHRYYGWGGLDYERFARQPIGVGEPVAALKAFLRERLGRDLPIALTEWNLGRHGGLQGMAAAIVIAEQLADYVRGGVDLATFWPLRMPGRGRSFRALLDTQTREPLVAYRVMQLLASNTREQLVAASTSQPRLVPFASRGADGKSLAVFLLNKSTHAAGLDVTLRLAGLRPGTVAARVLTAPALGSEDLVLRELPLARRRRGWAMHLPPHSIALVTCTP